MEICHSLFISSFNVIREGTFSKLVSRIPLYFSNIYYTFSISHSTHYIKDNKIVTVVRSQLQLYQNVHLNFY